jgi:hypothetical protein
MGWKSLLSALKDLVKQNHSDKVESTRVDDFGIDDECSCEKTLNQYQIRHGIHYKVS